MNGTERSCNEHWLQCCDISITSLFDDFSLPCSNDVCSLLFPFFTMWFIPCYWGLSLFTVTGFYYSCLRMTLWLWVPYESALNSLLLAFYSVTLTHNVLWYTTEYIVEQTLCKFISFPSQILIQQSTVLGSGLLSTANERGITKYGWWENSTETEILYIHSFSVLVNSWNFHLFCKCKDKPKAILKYIAPWTP